jgi:hypothetical protein
MAGRAVLAGELIRQWFLMAASGLTGAAPARPPVVLVVLVPLGLA